MFGSPGPPVTTVPRAAETQCQIGGKGTSCGTGKVWKGSARVYIRAGSSGDGSRACAGRSPADKDRGWNREKTSDRVTGRKRDREWGVQRGAAYRRQRSRRRKRPAPDIGESSRSGNRNIRANRYRSIRYGPIGVNRRSGLGSRR